MHACAHPEASLCGVYEDSIIQVEEVVLDGVYYNKYIHTYILIVLYLKLCTNWSFSSQVLFFSR